MTPRPGLLRGSKIKNYKGSNALRVTWSPPPGFSTVHGNTNSYRALALLILIVATDMEKNLESVLFHFRFGFSVIIIRVMRLDLMITSLTLFSIGRLKVKLTSYKRLTRFLTCTTYIGRCFSCTKITELDCIVRHRVGQPF